MPNQLPQSAHRNRPCPGCGGSGQTSYFGGASRFMLTWEDCPDCSGTGVLLEETGDPPADRPESKDNCRRDRNRV